MQKSKNLVLQRVEIVAPYLPIVAASGVRDSVKKMQAAADLGHSYLAVHGFRAFRRLVPQVHARFGISGLAVEGASLGAYGVVDAPAFMEAHPELVTMGLRPVEIIISAGDSYADPQPAAFVAFATEVSEFGTAAVLDALARDYFSLVQSLAGLVAKRSTMN